MLPNAQLGSVWIEHIVVETENWKHCNKIIFKCVNSTVELIFNLFKCMNSIATVHEYWFLSSAQYTHVILLFMRWKKKKKKRWNWNAQNVQSKQVLSETFLTLPMDVGLRLNHVNFYLLVWFFHLLFSLYLHKLIIIFYTCKKLTLKLLLRQYFLER